MTTNHDLLAQHIYDELTAVLGPLHSDHLMRDLDVSDVNDAVLLATDNEFKVTAEFHPQAWIRDNAVDVDPEGDTEWDATEFWHSDTVGDNYRAFLLGERGYINRIGDEVLDNDDVFSNDPNAPEWVRNWHGPFSIWLTIENA